jgi:thiosulfate dehydrogenase
MHRINTAAAFIKANMPLGQGGTLTNQQAWDVAAYINSKPRPPDPRTRGGPSK